MIEKIVNKICLKIAASSSRTKSFRMNGTTKLWRAL